jgi:hypothetical protein
MTVARLRAEMPAAEHLHWQIWYAQKAQQRQIEAQEAAAKGR